MEWKFLEKYKPMGKMISTTPPPPKSTTSAKKKALSSVSSSGLKNMLDNL